jgi:hypothetical protein
MVIRGLFTCRSTVDVMNKKHKGNRLLKNEKICAKSRDLVVYGPGECFGEYELVFGEARRRYDVVCTTDLGSVLKMDDTQFKGYFLNVLLYKDRIEKFTMVRERGLKAKINQIEKNLPASYQPFNFSQQMIVPQRSPGTPPPVDTIDTAKKKQLDDIINLKDLLGGMGVNERLAYQNRVEQKMRENGEQDINNIITLEQATSHDTKVFRDLSPGNPVRDRKSLENPKS